MTVSTTNRSKSYTGDNSTTPFATTFEFFDDSDLQVYIRTIATGAETLQTITTHYTVTGGDGSTGTVTMVTAPTTAQELHIRRLMPTTQLTDLSAVTSPPWTSIETQFDRLIMMFQELRSDFDDRALVVPVTDEDPSTGWPDMELPNQVDRAVATSVLGFNATTGEPEVDLNP